MMWLPKVLVTGAAGYVGSILCRRLLESNFSVNGLDLLLFGGESLVPMAGDAQFLFLKGDVSDADMVKQALARVDVVVHLAAIVGDPACKAFPEDATRLMDQGSRQLFELAQEAGVKHFIFASTCSNYGVMYGDSLLTEYSPLNPQSHYARLKVGFEEYLQAQTGSMAWTILRFATAFGHSPRPRFDLTVNHFTRDLTLGKQLEVFAADLWRPYCHVADLAEAVLLAIDKGPEKVGGAIFNIGHNQENYTKHEILKCIRRVTSHGEVVVREGNGGDVRNYRVDFSRAEILLGFKPQRNMIKGIQEIHHLVSSGLLADPFSKTYQNC